MTHRKVKLEQHLSPHLGPVVSYPQRWTVNGEDRIASLIITSGIVFNLRPLPIDKQLLGILPFCAND